MSNPIDSTGSAQSGSVVPASADGVTSVSSVSSGFSVENSLSYAEAGALQAEPSLLPEPAPQGILSEEYLQQAKLAKLDALVKTFESLLASDGDNVSSTQTLLMVMRGKVSDMRALMNTLIIKGVLSDQEALSDQKMKIPELGQTIKGKQGELDTLKSEQSQKQTVVDESKSRLDTLETWDIVGIYSDEIDSLKSLIASVETELAELKGKVASKEAEVAQLNSTLEALQLSGLMAKELDAFMDMMSVRLVRTPDKASVESGEEKVDELKRELKEISNFLAREDLKVLMEKQQTVQTLNEKINREYRLVGDSRLSATNLMSLKKVDSETLVSESGAVALTEQSATDVTSDRFNHIAQGILAAYHAAEHAAEHAADPQDMMEPDLEKGAVGVHVDTGISDYSQLSPAVLPGPDESVLDSGFNLSRATDENDAVSGLPGLEGLSGDIYAQQEQIDREVAEFLEDEQRSQEAIRRLRNV